MGEAKAALTHWSPFGNTRGSLLRALALSMASSSASWQLEKPRTSGSPALLFQVAGQTFTVCAATLAESRIAANPHITATRTFSMEFFILSSAL
ncbi:MAG: hypothetical protein WBL29_02945 [Burkholderiales bacterium]